MSKKSILIVVILFGLAVGAGFVYFFIQSEKKTQEAVSQERAVWQQKASELEKKADSLEKEVKKLTQEIQIAEQEPQPDVQRQQEAFGEQVPSQTETGIPPANIIGSVQAFFAYIDKKGYLRNHGIEVSAQDFFRSVIERLQATKPVVSGETQDAYLLIKNISFFFRALGKNDVLAIRDILKGESDISEQAIALFYQWLDPEQSVQDSTRITVPFETMYEYAAFFLQTIAGKSYLFRRDMRLRLLVQYYSVCIIDRAEDKMLNTYGIDLLPQVESLMQEISSSRLLQNRRMYLNTLAQIKNKRVRIRLEQ